MHNICWPILADGLPEGLGYGEGGREQEEDQDTAHVEQEVHHKHLCWEKLVKGEGLSIFLLQLHTYLDIVYQ